MDVLILGSKEYPFGTNDGEDPIPSGGMETYVNDLAPELAKLARLTIITRKFPGTGETAKIGDNISVIRVPWCRGKWKRNPSFNFHSFIRGLKAGKRMDIIYSNGVMSGFFGLILGKILGKPSVFRPAGIGFSQFGFPLRQMLFALERLVFSKSDAVVFHSEGEKMNAKRKLGMKLHHGHVILTGFPVEKFAKGSKKLGRQLWTKDEGVITSVSRFVPVKGLQYLIEACSKLNYDFKLMLVGSGPEEAALKKYVKDLGMDDWVIFTGFRHDVPDILAITDIFVISSLSEGLPTSLLEAMAAGNACIVTDIGLPIEHMKTGVVVEPGSAKALKDALKLLMEDDELRERVGRNARKFVRDNCTQEMAASSHIRLFMSLLQGSKGGSE